jgi:hypothetical protein
MKIFSAFFIPHWQAPRCCALNVWGSHGQILINDRRCCKMLSVDAPAEAAATCTHAAPPFPVSGISQAKGTN